MSIVIAGNLAVEPEPKNESILFIHRLVQLLRKGRRITANVAGGAFREARGYVPWPLL